LTGTLIILGGADGSVSAYERARTLGFRTVCVDIRPSAPAVELADEYLRISVRAPERIAAALLGREGREGIVGVLCPASDVGLPTQAWLTRHWNLPNELSRAAVQASVDKAVFRETCDRLALPSYRTVTGCQGSDLISRAQRLSFPVLVKPVDSSGSRGVLWCAGPEALEAAFAEAIAYSPSGRLVVEEFVEGEPLTIESLVVDGHVAFHAITKRTLTPPPYFVTSSHVLPVELPASTAADLLRMLDLVCAEIGYRNGPLTLDATLGSDGRIYLLEMSARMGGNGLADAIEHCYDIDLIGASIALAIGEEFELVAGPPRPTMVQMLTSDRAGRLIAIEGVRQVQAMPEVVSIRLFAEVGSYVRPYDQAGYKLGQVVLSAECPVRLRAAHAKLGTAIRFLVAGHDTAVPLP
jgi:biotin carboxylase